MKIQKTFLKSLLFVMIGSALFLGIQAVLTENWDYIENQRKSIRGIEYAGKDVIDVLFLGTSHMQNGISPMEIYEETGITSYNLATSKQPIEGSYFLLQSIYKKQTPKIVVLDVSNLFFESTDDASWRYILDNMPFSISKMEMLYAYDSVEEGTGIETVLFPILKYHSRWDQLRKDDFRIDQEFYYSAGEYVVSNYQGTDVTRDEVNEQALWMHSEKVCTTTIMKDGSVKKYESESELYPAVVSEHNLDYLQKIKKLCDEHNTKFILTKVPVRMLYTQYGSSAWTEEKYNIIKNIALQNDLQYIDLSYDIGIQIDFTKETKDGGAHLNVRGAEKISSWFGGFLSEQEGIEARSNKIYDNALEKYRKVKKVAMMESEQDFNAYMSYLIENKGKWIILMAVAGDYTTGLNENDLMLFQDLGLDIIREGSQHDAYISIIDGGNVIYESVSNRDTAYQDEVDKFRIELYSPGYRIINRSSILVNGIETSVNWGGINVTVIDKESQLIIDQCALATFTEYKYVYRNQEPQIWLKQYMDGEH